MQTELSTQDVAFGGQPQLTDRDREYVRATFRAQTEAEQDAAADGCAPKPAYVLPDGTPMVPATPDAELAAVADADELPRVFTTRWLEAGGPPQAVPTELGAWLDGRYGVCLPSPGPELILAKEGIAQAIEALIARPEPQKDWWRNTLRAAVAAYDALVLPFASIDPERFGRATSRSLLVDAVREQWPEVFEPTAEEMSSEHGRAGL